MSKKINYPTLSIDVKVEPGLDIETACRDAVSLADKLIIGVEFKFNGVKVYVRPDTDPVELAGKYYLIKSDTPLKFIS